MSSETSVTVKLGILGCASIAEKIVRAVLLLPEIRLVALGSRSLAKAQEFAKRNGLPADAKVYGSYDEVLDDTSVDAVYIPLPTGLHVHWVLKAAEKKKHVLLEKPPAHTMEEMELMTSALEKQGLQFMDGTMFVHHPRSAEMHRILHNPQLFGTIREISGIFNTNMESTFGPTWSQSNVRGQAHLDGLGSLGDLGWYCVRGILWAFDFEMPYKVIAHPGTRFNDAGVIISCGATLEWKDGRTATFRASFLTDMVMRLTVMGSRAVLDIGDFVIPVKEDVATFQFNQGSAWVDRSTGWTRNTHVHEVKTELPQEALMLREFAQLVKGIITGTGKPNPIWPSVSKKTQAILNIVKESIEHDCSPITLS